MRHRGSAWERRVFVETDAVTSKKRYTTRTVRGGKREAQRALAQMVTDAELRLSAHLGDRRRARRALVRVRGDGVLPEDSGGDPGMLDRYVLPALGAGTLSKRRGTTSTTSTAIDNPTAAQAADRWRRRPCVASPPLPNSRAISCSRPAPALAAQSWWRSPWYPDSVRRRFRKLCEREAVTGFASR